MQRVRCRSWVYSGLLRTILNLGGSRIGELMDDLHSRAYGRARLSEPRLAVAHAAMSFGRAFTVDELVSAVRSESPAAATATVYRSVAAMEETGFLERVGEREGATLYARCDTATHHHHIVCDSCGKTTHAPCPLDLGIAAPPRADGFVITRHEVTLYGLCPACAARSEEH